MGSTRAPPSGALSGAGVRPRAGLSVDPRPPHEYNAGVPSSPPLATALRLPSHRPAPAWIPLAWTLLCGLLAAAMLAAPLAGSHVRTPAPAGPLAAPDEAA